MKNISIAMLMITLGFTVKGKGEAPDAPEEAHWSWNMPWMNCKLKGNSATGPGGPWGFREASWVLRHN